MVKTLAEKLEGETPQQRLVRYFTNKETDLSRKNKYYMNSINTPILENSSLMYLYQRNSLEN
jgi:hypothetical protein